MYVLDFYENEDLKISSVALEDTVTVGRSKDIDVTLNHKSVSRHHAIFVLEESNHGEGVMLRDEGSTNGTIVNGRKVKGAAVRIEPRDHIQVGVFGVVLLEEEGPEAPPDMDSEQTLFLDSVVTNWDSLPVERLRVLYEFAGEDLVKEEAALVEVTGRTIRSCLRFDVLSILLESETGIPVVSTWTPEGPRGSLPDPASEEMLERCRREGRVIVAGSDDLGSPRTVDATMRMDFLASTVCVPLANSTEKGYGAILLQSLSATCYDSEDLKFLVLVARTVATSIERQRAESDLLQAKERAEASNRAKSEFLANISHELRTPLHGILSFAGMGVKRHATAVPEKLLGYFQKIQQSGTTLLDLVNDLLDLAKLESGKMDFDFQPTEISVLVATVVDEFVSFGSKGGPSVHFAKPAPRIEARVDGTRIKQVIRNLVGNAVKFSPKSGRVEVEFSEGHGSIIFSVSDEGPGIPEEELEAVFDKFVQSTKTKTGAGGTGLGLAISREIIHAHEGRLWGENNPKGGARFSFEIPTGETAEHHSVDVELLRSGAPSA